MVKVIGLEGARYKESRGRPGEEKGIGSMGLGGGVGWRGWLRNRSHCQTRRGMTPMAMLQRDAIFLACRIHNLYVRWRQ